MICFNTKYDTIKKSNKICKINNQICTLNLEQFNKMKFNISSNFSGKKEHIEKEFNDNNIESFCYFKFLEGD